jgi:hypothetical protein
VAYYNPWLLAVILIKNLVVIKILRITWRRKSLKKRKIIRLSYLPRLAAGC